MDFAPTVGVSSTHPADHSALPVWNAENWFYEDFEVGHRIRSLRRTISEGESMQFNALVAPLCRRPDVRRAGRHIRQAALRQRRVSADGMLQTLIGADGHEVRTTRSPIRVDGERERCLSAAPALESTAKRCGPKWGSDTAPA
jgi:hypothetical protein